MLPAHDQPIVNAGDSALLLRSERIDDCLQIQLLLNEPNNVQFTVNPPHSNFGVDRVFALEIGKLENLVG